MRSIDAAHFFTFIEKIFSNNSSMIRMLIFTVIVLCFGCVAGNSPNKTGRPSSNDVSGITPSTGSEVEVDQPNLTLAQYLRRIPGVRVTGAGGSVRVIVRSGSSLTQSNEPLYVIDNIQIGRSYSQVESLVSVNDIQSIQVLKSSAEAQGYGYGSNNGVIIIRTKKN